MDKYFLTSFLLYWHAHYQVDRKVCDFTIVDEGWNQINDENRHLLIWSIHEIGTPYLKLKYECRELRQVNG